MTYVMNTSGLRPLGRAVLIEVYEPEKKQSTIVIPDHVQDRLDSVETRAIVIAVGPACWPDEPPRAAPGDKVYIAKFAGTRTKGTKDGKQYRFINDRDIYAAIAEEAEA